MSEIVVVITGATGPSGGGGGGGASALDDLTDVTITAAAAGDILRYSGSAWVDAVGTTHFEAAGGIATHAAVTSSVHGISAFGATLVDDADAATARTTLGLGNLATATTVQEVIGIAVSDETTAITTGTAKVTFRVPFAMTLTAVRANLNTASSSGTPTVDINEGGSTILSTKLTIDANEKTSTTAATAAVISDSALADDAEITIDIDVAGTGAKGLKVWLIGTRTV
jgi:hypothetical protein